jgi:hypothetical protein
LCGTFLIYIQGLAGLCIREIPFASLAPENSLPYSEGAGTAGAPGSGDQLAEDKEIHAWLN